MCNTWNRQILIKRLSNSKHGVLPAGNADIAEAKLLMVRVEGFGVAHVLKDEAIVEALSFAQLPSSSPKHASAIFLVNGDFISLQIETIESTVQRAERNSLSSTVCDRFGKEHAHLS